MESRETPRTQTSTWKSETRVGRIARNVMNLQYLEIEYIIHHVVLPPQLPDSDEYNPSYDQKLLDLVLASLVDLRESCLEENSKTIDLAISTIKNLAWCRTKHTAQIKTPQLKKSLAELANGTETMIPLLIDKQNAAILISRCEEGIIFEYFELTPTNEAAMGKGRLVRAFPAFASEIPASLARDSALQKAIIDTITTLASEQAPHFQPVSSESPDPGLVTDFLMNITAALGKTVNMTRISKNTREDVIMGPCESLWRRSPMWLLIRVTLQLVFFRAGIEEQYKAFMVLLLSRIIESATDHHESLGSELIHNISAKISRRLRKMEAININVLKQSAWTDQIMSRLKSAHSLITENWNAFCDSTADNIDFSNLENLQPVNDLDTKIPELDKYVSQTVQKKSAVTTSHFTPSSVYPRFSMEELPSIEVNGSEHTFFHLAAMEKWTEENLESWIQHRHQDPTVCEQLRCLVRNYYTVAIVQYKHIPLKLSIMYLTALEIWIECDKLACERFPQLHEYDPEVQVEQLLWLYLDLKSLMNRFHAVERYIQSRRQMATKGMPSVYRQFGVATSFAVRYFDQSPKLQKLHEDILREAAIERREKANDLKEIKAKYDDLMAQYHQADCELEDKSSIEWGVEVWKSVHKSRKCGRCSLLRQANALRITIFEWPVSADPYIAKATLFELQPPELFCSWRDLSLYIQDAILEFQSALPQPVDKDESLYGLEEHKGLSQLLDLENACRRLSLMSKTKSKSGSWKRITPDIEERDVCIQSSLKYAYFDESLWSWSTELDACRMRTQKYQYQMPERSKVLERFLVKTSSAPDGPSFNDPLAKISDCPSHFSSDEFKAFTALPLGRNLIYHNILLQLAMPAIDFAKSETLCLFYHAMHEAGPSAERAERANHFILTDEAFCNALLTEIGAALEERTGNWEAWRAAACFSLVVRRILTLNLSNSTTRICFQHLDSIHDLCDKWYSLLSSRIISSSNDQQRIELQHKVSQIAWLYTSTFDVEDRLFEKLLKDPNKLSTFLKYCILLEENSSSMRSGSNYFENIFLSSWQSLMYRFFPQLHRTVLTNSSILSSAIAAYWEDLAHDERATWSCLEEPRHLWFTATFGSRSVYFNLLTAEVIIDGAPLTRLPYNYIQHPAYITLFNDFAMEAGPTLEQGYQYAGKSTYHNYRLHFGMEANDMRILAVRNDVRLELVPSHLFNGRLPESFISDFTHWYDHQHKEVKFCPRTNPWPSHTIDTQWILTRNLHSWRLSHGARSIVSIESTTANTISKIFSTLEDPTHIHILLDTTDQTVRSSLEIDLPRHGISFDLQKGSRQIMSRQYVGMSIDPDQRIGTLIGLKNRMVLKSPKTRVILLPEGLIQYEKNTEAGHICVTITNSSAGKVRFYELDSTLRRIRDDGSVHSKLLLAYLLALTSHCLPNPQSGTTGVEASLEILRSASLRSFEYLRKDEVESLVQIGNLSAIYQFPKRKEISGRMQQIMWDDQLSPSIQDLQFRREVREILEQARKTSLFYPESDPIPSWNELEWDVSISCLEQRAAIRLSTFQVCGFGGENFAADHDLEYTARDRDADLGRGRQVYLVTNLIIQKESALHVAIPDLKSSLIAQNFDKATVKGATPDFDIRLLRYDPMWLDTGSTVLQDNWCNIHDSFRKLFNEGMLLHHKWSIIMFLSTLAYSETADMTSVQALCAIFRFPELRAINIPKNHTFDLAQSYQYKARVIRAQIKLHAKDIVSCPEFSRIPRLATESETQVQRMERIHSEWHLNQESALSKFENLMACQWPNDEPSLPSARDIKLYFDVTTALESIKKQFQTWNNNREFMDYLGRLSKRFQRLKVHPVLAPVFLLAPPTRKNSKSSSRLRSYSAAAIVRCAPPSLSWVRVPNEPHISILEESSLSKHQDTQNSLKHLCNNLAHAQTTASGKNYVMALRASCRALDKFEKNNMTQRAVLSAELDAVLLHHLQDCYRYFNDLNAVLTETAQGMEGSSDHITCYLGLGPRLSPSLWLGLLRRENFKEMSAPWKSFLVQYGMCLVQLSRAHRLVESSHNAKDLAVEFQNIGHQNWDPHDWPETLLMEAEFGFVVRETQATIAKEMRDPTGNKNTVMQLNMGEGKSSVILPIVAASLTDKKNLVQVVVTKPQSKQMFQMLVAKLGGLLHRRIYHLPFSRALKLSAGDAKTILEICHECVENRGVMLLQPEHLLSLKLMGIERRIAASDAAQSILGIQQFFNEKSRALVDECDEAFNKLELVFTMGSQQTVDLAPLRWLITQQVLGLVWQYSCQVKNELSLSLEVHSEVDGRFPMIRILRNDASEMLHTLLTKHIMEHGLVGLPTRNEAEATRGLIERYIGQPHISQAEVKAVEESNFWTPSTKETLLLVRGILAGGLLRFTLSSKRFRVNYGLDPERKPLTQLAVPYRFKDGPSMRSEFAHPDVLVILTCLSYYYGGLNDDQLFDTFTHLFNSDQAAAEYACWVSTAAPNMPSALRTLAGFNIKDRLLCVQQVFPHLRFSKDCIDYFLSRLVFPKELRQFKSKISASGWDLGAISTHPTTGFSGTCDLQFLLPLSVRHLNLPDQNHSNALVLGHLFKDASIVKSLPPRTTGTDASHLLSVIATMDPEIRVVLDCGAQILEQNNTQVARTWLSMSDAEKIQACVFFYNEELSIIDHTGRIESFQTSPLSLQLDKCVVYLDEAHTRGIDLRLPGHYRAAVTLGAGLTKDRLMQACMRMRKLGHGQTVAFIVPEEISTKIRDRLCMEQDTEIELINVLGWCVTETWLDLKKNIPIWAMQGARFYSQEPHFHGVETTETQAAQFLQDEAQSLENRYKPRQSHLDHLNDWDMSSPRIQEIIKRCEAFGALGFSAADLNEEQERELAPEKEEERQTEHPPKAKSAATTTHADLRKLVKLGSISATSPAIVPAFQALQSTSAGCLYTLAKLPASLHVTRDFMSTIKAPSASAENPFIMDSYQRPVQWILSVPEQGGRTDKIDKLIIISPHEANELYGTIKRFAKVTMHLFAPRTNADHKSLDKLQLWTLGRSFIPTSLPRSAIVQLNLFAGSLYLRSYDEYAELCAMLGLLPTHAQPGQVALPDGFITTCPPGQWNLTESPVSLLRTWIMKIRRGGEGGEKTHLGRILDGVRLEPADFLRDVRMTG